MTQHPSRRSASATDGVAARILAGLPTAVLVLGADSCITFANPRAGEILRTAPAALIGRPIGSISSQLALALEEPVELRAECDVQARDRTVRIGYHFADIAELAPQRAVVFQDISEWHEMRMERDRLLQLAAVGEALPTILHELKNPLAAVTATVEVLLEEVPAGQVRDDLHAVLSEVRRMRLGFDGVGAVGRNLRSRRHAAIDLACREAFQVLAARAHESGIHTRMSIQDMPLLPLDPAVVRAVVFNLVTNSIHACTKGNSISLRARLVASGMIFELQVSDTGKGMDQATFDLCTNLFYTTKRSGSGIGLALCRRATEESGGELQIRSVPGFGTTVTVLVPVFVRGPSNQRHRKGRNDVTH